MTHALDRIVEYPHAPVFDKAPKEALALRVRHADGLSWRVERGVLKATVGTEVSEYQLVGITLGQLSDALQADGFQVLYENPAMTGRAAYTLLSGAKNQDESNGDHLYAYTSLLWCLYDAYAAELDHAEYEIGEALRQMIMTQAEGEWLDVWANLYGIPRLPGETDAELQVRLPEEAFALRVNGIAIEERVDRATGKTVEIFEPWKLIFTLDQSSLSGGDRFEDDVYYNYHVIQPVSRTPVDFSDVMPVVDRNRAAGVELYDPQVLMPPSLVEAPAVISGSGIMQTRAVWLPYEDRLLDYMFIEDAPILNHTSRHIREIGRLSQTIAYPGAPGAEVAITSKWSRDYRIYGSVTEYGRTWTGYWLGNWTDDITIHSKHTSLS